MVLEPTGAKVLRNALRDGPMKEKIGAGWNLLATLDVMYPVWQEMIALGQFRLRGLGASLKRATEELLQSTAGRSIITQIPNLPSPKSPLRADDHGLHFMPFSHETKPARVERAGMAAALMVVCAAELCDASFQKRVRAIVDAQNQARGEYAVIEHTPAPPKKYDRIMNKHGDAVRKNAKGMYELCEDPDADHGSAEHPRAACNVDTVRCGLTCVPELAPALHKALGEVLGVRVRTKNNLRASDKEAEAMYYYLAILDNYEVSFAPDVTGDSGVTHGDVAAALRKRGEEKFHLQKDMVNSCHELARWLEEEHGQTHVRLMCETQIILPIYLEGRKRSHLPYKIVRCADPADLRQDLNNL